MQVQFSSKLLKLLNKISARIFINVCYQLYHKMPEIAFYLSFHDIARHIFTVLL